MSERVRRATNAGGAAARLLGAVLSPAGRRARLAVFCYHQVLERSDPLRVGEPDVQQFRADVETIGRVFNVLPLREAVRRLADGSLPARAACITFDDGYANNHELAAPIFERAGVPATFFVTGGALDEGIMWNDLVIEAAGRRRGSFRLSGVSGVDADALAGADARLVQRVLAQLKYRPVRERWTAAERIYRENVGADLPRLMMTSDMVADLARRGFEIGGHTLQHPILKVIDEEEARAEINGCSAWIRGVTGAAPTSFAYPNGKPGLDFTIRDCRLAAEAGFESAVSTEWRVASGGTDVFNIPRVGPWWRLHRSLADGFLRTYLQSYRPGRQLAAS